MLVFEIAGGVFALLFLVAAMSSMKDVHDR